MLGHHSVKNSDGELVVLPLSEDLLSVVSITTINRSVKILNEKQAIYMFEIVPRSESVPSRTE